MIHADLIQNEFKYLQMKNIDLNENEIERRCDD